MTTKLLINVTLSCASAILTTLLYKYFYRERNEVIFFYGYQSICDHHMNDTVITRNALQRTDCSQCKVQKIIEWICEARKTLDICLYMFSSKQLSEAVIDAHKRGVCVRLILDCETIKTTWKMGTLGISKKVKNKSYGDMLMHHKFIIIDSKTVILGSLNWTLMGIRHNWENVFITNEPELVNPFNQEFQKLWKTFN